VSTKNLSEEIKMKKETLCETIGGPGCGLKRVLDLVGGKWKILILCAINVHQTMRYGELRKAIIGITNTMLANSLKELETAGLVTRTLYDERPIRVEYQLTDKAKSLIPILLELQEWGRAHLDA
jgi:DNA-binding HxlR family transcriptional regulator